MGSFVGLALTLGITPWKRLASSKAYSFVAMDIRADFSRHSVVEEAEGVWYKVPACCVVYPALCAPSVSATTGFGLCSYSWFVRGNIPGLIAGPFCRRATSYER